MMCIKYDKGNKQIDYQYIARDIKSGRLVVGYIVVERLWYQEPHYFIYYNDYKPGGFCGGCIDLGIKKVEVDPSTITQYNQLTSIKYNQENYHDDTKIEQIQFPYKNSIIIYPNSDWQVFADGTNGLIYRKEDILEVENKLGKFGHCKYRKQKLNTEKKNFETFTSSIIARQREERRKDLYNAVLEFWNNHKSLYSEIYIMRDQYDFETIEQTENGKFTSSMLSDEYDDIKDLLMDFVTYIDPNEVGGFNYGGKRKSRLVNDGTNLPF